MNAEIVARLEQSFNPNPGKPFDMEQYNALKIETLRALVSAIEDRDSQVAKKKKASD
jgi:hypothetical protein